MMTDEDKTKKQLTQERAGLRQRIAVSEKPKARSKQAEQKLEDSEARYRRLFETAQDGILILNALDGKITDANPFLLDLLGYSKQDILGKTLWDIGVFKDIRMSKKSFKELQESGYVRYEDLPLETKGGLPRSVEFVSNVYAVNGDKVIQCNIRDISDRKQAELEIEKLARFPSENPAPVLRVGRDGTILYANQASLPLLSEWNCQAGQLLPEQWCGIVLDTLNSGSSKDTDIKCGERVFSITLVPLAATGYVNMYARDITERKQAEEALKTSAEQYQNLYEEAPNAYFTVGTDGRIKIANRSATKLLGYSMDELIGKPVIDLYAETPSGKARASEIFQRFTDGGETKADELQMLTADGRELWITLSVKPVLDADGRVIESRSVVVDITEKKQAEMKAREFSVLKEVDRLRSELLANISHELRTPLASIKGFISTLLRTDTKWSDEEQLDFLQTVDQETDRLTRLISDILDISRIYAGALKLTRNKYTVSEILGLISSTLANIAKNHKLEVVVPSELPPLLVDEVRIGQVFTNLVENATKFSDWGSTITIGAHLSGDEIIVSITDRGEGIPRELQDKLFDRLYQTTSFATGRKKEGTGLGLSICRGIIEAHKGKIWVESKGGKGSTFSFSLMVSKGGKQDAEDSGH
jgi:PAS domain S-box-containing protein